MGSQKEAIGHKGASEITTFGGIKIAVCSLRAPITHGTPMEKTVVFEERRSNKKKTNNNKMSRDMGSVSGRKYTLDGENSTDIVH